MKLDMKLEIQEFDDQTAVKSKMGISKASKLNRSVLPSGGQFIINNKKNNRSSSKQLSATMSTFNAFGSPLACGNKDRASILAGLGDE